MHHLGCYSSQADHGKSQLPHWIRYLSIVTPLLVGSGAPPIQSFELSVAPAKFPGEPLLSLSRIGGREAHSA